jgi:hypothetical protein
MHMCIVYIFSYNSFKKEHLMLQNDDIYRTYIIIWVQYMSCWLQTIKWWFHGFTNLSAFNHFKNSLGFLPNIWFPSPLRIKNVPRLFRYDLPLVLYINWNFMSVVFDSWWKTTLLYIQNSQKKTFVPSINKLNSILDSVN